MSGAEIIVPLLFVCATPYGLSRHIMLKIYTDDGKRRMKERLSKDYAALKERNIALGFKFEKQSPVYSRTGHRNHRTQTGVKTEKYTVIKIAQPDATLGRVRQEAYKSVDRCCPNLCPCQFGRTHFGSAKMDTLDTLCCCWYSVCHGADNASSGVPMVYVSYTNQEGVTGGAGVDRLLAMIDAFEAKQRNIALAMELSSENVNGNLAPDAVSPKDIQMSRDFPDRNIA